MARAFAIVTNGIDNYMALTHEVVIPSSEDFTIRFVGNLVERYGAQLGKTGTFDNHIRLYSQLQPIWEKPSEYKGSIDFGGVSSTLVYLTKPKFDEPYDYELKRVNGVVDLVDTATQTSLLVATVTNSGEFSFNTLFRYANSGSYLEGNQQLIQITSTSANHKWDASASDYSAGVQPDLVDTISGNTAKGRKFATDGSAWVNLGGNTSTEQLSGTATFNSSATLTSSGVKSSSAAAQLSSNTSSLIKGSKHAQAIADLSATSNVTSTGTKFAFSAIQSVANSVTNSSGVKHMFGASNINVATSFTISGTAAELIIKSGAASLLAVTSMNSIGYKSSYSNVAITELTNINVAGYKYTLASASINITTNELSSGRKSSQGKKSESQTTVLNSLGAKYSFGNSSLSTSTITMAMGVGGSFVPISRKIIIPGRINSLVLNGQISSGLTIQGIF